MLKRLAPIGTILKNVYMESYEKEFTHGRQIGTYSLLLTTPYKAEINKFTDVMVVDYGFRSLSVLPIPLKLNTYSRKIFQYLPNIGSKRAEKIHRKLPYKNLDAFKNELDDPEIITKYSEFLSFE
jgi:radical SAM superfamily enzyme with C-terminal helix-hairpin-helix motif